MFATTRAGPVWASRWHQPAQHAAGQTVMPIYGFSCNTCKKQFETLVRSSDTPECPSCGSTDLTRQLALIASPNKGAEDAGSFSGGGGGHTCGGGCACG